MNLTITTAKREHRVNKVFIIPRFQICYICLISSSLQAPVSFQRSLIFSQLTNLPFHVLSFLPASLQYDH